MSAFTASKYALEGFTDAIRAEAEPLGVHIGQVCIEDIWELDLVSVICQS